MLKFIIHGIPTDIASTAAEAREAVAAQIRANHPQLPFAQILVWMCKPDSLTTKKHTSMIIAFTGSYTTEAIGFQSIVLFNKYRTLHKYLLFNSTTLCHKCRKYGHHTERCKETTVQEHT